MRKLILSFAVVFSAIFASCHYDGKCIDPEYYTLAFAAGDTAAVVETFQKDGTFSSRIDSFYTNEIATGNESLVKLHRFRALKINTYDWRVSLRPSGKVYNISNITIIDREERKPRTDNRRCGNSVTLVSNGVSYEARVVPDVTSSVSFNIR
jgi:hypothetical protein